MNYKKKLLNENSDVFAQEGYKIITKEYECPCGLGKIGETIKKSPTNVKWQPRISCSECNDKYFISKIEDTPGGNIYYERRAA